MAFQPWELIAGLGIFLFGMMNLEQALQVLGTRSFRRVLREQTSTPLRGVLVGIVSTACLQSSSMVGLIVLAFVGAGILKMTNALGVIFGANLGTTFTGWLVATLGFKLNLTQYALPLVAIGALGMVFLPNESRRHAQVKSMLGLGFLLMGLEFMKTSMSFLSEQVSIDVFQDYPLLLFVLGGVVFTALIQSSSATMMIVLSAIDAGVLPLTTAAAIIVGADLGTTGTVLMGSLKGSPDKRRVALSHFIFNLITDLAALILLLPLLSLITGILGIGEPMYALVMFHSLFNVIGILLFLPIIPQFSRWLQNRFSQQDGSGCLYISKVPYNVTDAAIEALRQETLQLFYKVLILNLRVLKIQPEQFLHGYQALTVYQDISQHKFSYDEQYSDIKHTEQLVLNYAQEILQEKSAADETKHVAQLLQAIRNLVYSAKSLKDVRQNIVELRLQSEDDELIETIRHDVRIIYRHLLNLIEKTDPLLSDDKFKQLNSDINHSHDKLHQLISHNRESVDLAISLSSMFNINRELLVSHQALMAATAELMDTK